MHRLSEREKEILRWSASGKTAWETGQILNISRRTVEWHFAQIYRKLDTTTKKATIALAVRGGLLYFALPKLPRLKSMLVTYVEAALGLVT